EARARLAEGRDRAHRLAEDLAPALALRVAVLEVVLHGARPRDHIEGRVRDVLADLAADGDLGAPVDLHVLDDALVLLRQELRQRVLGLVQVVVGVEELVRQAEVAHGILLVRLRESYSHSGRAAISSGSRAGPEVTRDLRTANFL